MAEIRKRPFMDDVDTTVPKRRALTSAVGSPVHVNGVHSPTPEPRDENDLENFRKRAIFRRMRHYSRENDRGHKRVAELEEKQKEHLCKLAAIDESWIELVAFVRRVMQSHQVKLEGLDAQDSKLFSSVNDMEVSDITQVLRKRLHASQELVASFVKLAYQAQAIPADDIRSQLQALQNETITLRAELRVREEQLRGVEDQRQKLHDDLMATEMRLDRLRATSSHEVLSHVEPEVVKKENKEGTTNVLQPSSSSPRVDNTSNMVSQIEDESIVVAQREQILALQTENVHLRVETDRLKADLQTLPESVIMHTPLYKALANEVSTAQGTLQMTETKVHDLQRKLEDVRTGQEMLAQDFVTSALQSLEQAQQTISKRVEECTRLRQQREQQQAELSERKAQMSVKLASLEEFKLLTESQSQRIAVLQSEVKRLKARLAAGLGDEDLLSFLTGDSSDDLSYVSQLKKRLEEAEKRNLVLDATLASVNEKDPDLVDAASTVNALRLELKAQEQKRAEYESVFGPNVPKDVAALTKRLQAKEAELNAAQLAQKHRDQAEAATFDELDKLSAAWEALERQVKSKAFDLSVQEERVTRAALEKSKAENKYFAAMRDKEAQEAERKASLRAYEKQTKLLESHVAASDKLKDMITTQKNEISTLIKLVDVHKLEKDLAATDIELRDAKLTSSEHRNRVLQTSMNDMAQEIVRLKTLSHDSQEEAKKAKKEAERVSEKLKVATSARSGSSSDREQKLQEEVDKCMRLLKCSTCQSAMRSTVITKCMHSFCKACVDARIAHRQRKCPACNLAFAATDVQTLFFQ